ncbi:MAG: 9-O-acetylesterase, partial [Flavobacterium sp.]
RAKQYNTLFPALIEDWRTKFNNPVLPFYFAQLAGYGRGEGDPTSWPLLREAQLNASRLPFTAMAVTADIGDEQDIHPKNKQDVGKRLALIALAKTYGKQVDFSGPVFKSMRKNKNELILSFDFGQNLVLKASGANGAFSIAGNDRVFYPASATIVNGKVVLMSSEVKNPVAARYAWANFPDAVLINKSGLPAGPFRTDDW